MIGESLIRARLATAEPDSKDENSSRNDKSRVSRFLGALLMSLITHPFSYHIF